MNIMEQRVQQVFSRYETKYLLQDRQLEAFLRGTSGHTEKDAYGDYTICSVYFDTEDYSLIRSSIERPVFKEKLRLRSYGVPKQDDPVFLELKRKFDGVVYKRREAMTFREAADYLNKDRRPASSGQVLREVDYFMRLYHPVPKVYLAYDRTAFSGVEDDGLRITLDQNIRWRDSALDLSQGDWGAPLLRPGLTLLEIKSPGAVPLWLARLLSELQIYPASYSKYGACYKQYLIDSFLNSEVFHCA